MPENDLDTYLVESVDLLVQLSKKVRICNGGTFDISISIFSPFENSLWHALNDILRIRLDEHLAQAIDPVNTVQLELCCDPQRPETRTKLVFPTCRIEVVDQFRDVVRGVIAKTNTNSSSG